VGWNHVREVLADIDLHLLVERVECAAVGELLEVADLVSTVVELFREVVHARLPKGKRVITNDTEGQFNFSVIAAGVGDLLSQR
jgi:hypothetical protein